MTFNHSKSARTDIGYARVASFAWLFVLHIACASANDKPIHLGVATCAGSNCHGATSAQNSSTVRQNEFVIWHRQDKHAQAYAILHEPAAQRIATNLGLKNAHEAPACLVCHSDYVPQAERGKRFQLSDGVGCEACHGGAEQWLGTHVSGKATHAENVALGLKSIGEPQRRAGLCMACHSGDATHEMTHNIMGAGHPRLVFELDTFSEIQPAHYVVDKDYRQRKPTADHATTWALGQIQASRSLLHNLRDGKHLGEGLFPEFIYFNCHSCHRSMLDPSYREMETGAAPGEVRLADANFAMLGFIIDITSSEQASRYRTMHKALQKSVQHGAQDTSDIATKLLRIVDALEKKLRSGVSAQDAGAITKRIISAGAAQLLVDYARAEQATMALDALRSSAALSSTEKAQLSPTIDALFAVLKDEKTFSGAAVSAVFQDAAGRINP